MPTFKAPDVEIAYEDTGGTGPVVVFSHGILMDKDMFDLQVEVLRDEFRCIAWDERAHGDTSGGVPFTYWDSAQDLLNLMDHLDVDRAFLVGMSQGGFVSLRAALLAPERVRGLGLIDTQAGLENPAHVPGYQLMLDQWKAEGATQPLMDGIAAIIVAPADPTPWFAKWSKREDAESLQAAFDALVSRDDIHDRLPEISAPAIVIHGDADPAITMEQAEALCEGLPGCEGIVRVEGGGHLSNVSHPGIVTEALRDFFRRHAS
jgi:3-oxoadipate enol-lactonase